MRQRLTDGTLVLLRPVRAADAPALVRAVGACSPESLRARFLSTKRELSARELRYLTDVDQRDHVAVVAVLAERPEVIAGIGRWVRDREDPTRAEIAFLVVDAHHGLGLGTALGLWLADAAVARGVERLTATILAGNASSARILGHVADRLRTAHGGSVDELVLDLPADDHRAEAYAAVSDLRFHEQPTMQITRPRGARRPARGGRRPAGPPVRPRVPHDPDWARAA